MKVGLVGYAGSGKSTLYRAAAQGEAKGEITAVPVPDPRFEKIVAQVQPKKATPATVIFHDDLEDVAPSGKALSVRFLDDARKMDLLLLVVRAFDSPMAPYHAQVDPKRDFENLSVELVLADLQMVETRLERLAKSLNARQPGHVEYNEKQLFEKLKAPLEEGKPVRSLELSPEEKKLLVNYQFLTARPFVVAFNVAESELASTNKHLPSYDQAKSLSVIPSAVEGSQIQDSHFSTEMSRQARHDMNEGVTPTSLMGLPETLQALAGTGIPAFAVCATIEEEIAQLDQADQPEFLASLGLNEPASARMIRAVYDALGLITFFTAGEKETRAWPLKRGSSALEAAASIHTDIAKGFIRAETVSYADYEAHGSLDAAYSGGKMRLEGKDYVVQDGDLLHIRNKM